MPPQKKNPLGLNALQLKTLTLVQAAAQLSDHAEPDPQEPGTMILTKLPHPHGDHFHLGDAVVHSRDATGLNNQGVWAALVRKGLIRSSEQHPVMITAAGIAYDTGLAETILHRADH